MKSKKKVLVVKIETLDELTKVCDKFDNLGCKWDDGTGKEGHLMTGLGIQSYDYNRGVRYLVQHGTVIKKSISNKGFDNDKFVILTSSEFLKN